MGWLKGKSSPETIYFPMKIMGFYCSFSLKPINWSRKILWILVNQLIMSSKDLGNFAHAYDNQLLPEAHGVSFWLHTTPSATAATDERMIYRTLGWMIRILFSTFSLEYCQPGPIFTYICTQSWYFRAVLTGSSPTKSFQKKWLMLHPPSSTYSLLKPFLVMFEIPQLAFEVS